MPLPNPGWNVVYGEIPAASKWSQLGANDDALAAGTGFNTGAIPATALAGSIPNSKLDASANKWEELSRTTLASDGTTINSASFTARKYLLIQTRIVAKSANWTSGRLRFNGDTGSNYAYRLSTNNGADSTGTADGIPVDTGSTGIGQHIHELFIANVINKEKPLVGFVCDGGSGTGAGLIPNRRDIFGKWANSTQQITQVQIFNGAVGSTFEAGSEMLILGHD